jgi:hypothetical protein
VLPVEDSGGNQPSMTGNSLSFEVTIMSSLTQQPMPMLQLTDLDLLLAL